MTTPRTGFQPGETLTRDEIHPVLGGSGYAGICPAVEKQNVLIFSDSEVGKRYGYRDGWLAEDDDLGPVFTYTGTGKQDDQALKGGNIAILKHAEMGRTLHLFIAVGKVPGTDKKTHKYIGQFKVDERKPYETRVATDEQRKVRNVIVFRLRPIGPYIRTASDTLQLASTPRSLFSQTAGRFARSVRRQRRQLQPQTNIDHVEATRDDLADAFEDHKVAQGETIGQLELEMRNTADRLTCGLYSQTNNTVYEPTGSTASEPIAQAITQLLLARHYLRDLEPDQPLNLMLLTPALPREDLRGLLAEHGIGIVYRTDSGDFAEFTTSSAPPGSAPRSFRCLDCPVSAA
ncbi:hypothetical protein J7F01_05310 [Streptomyces sp. ISL-22]|uniref:hypothetical protein n=1 Tax=unclassified Streptomyces TaxID=2593676 RepID=UPI001BE5F743|nr:MULTISPECIES: hypothetical protein [unclassified Streptomyces]MBT2418279.1 hypothetical protein [Streptomyces sp. ISL-24]MBT2431627.1 hypothetical protein [Streptomyces sp. ISL-22]